MATGSVMLVDMPEPTPAPGELLVKVRACGVCRTDLHLRDGDLPMHRSVTVPGHEVVGEVVACGSGATVPLGTRVGIAWLRGGCATRMATLCRHCARGAENLCPNSSYTGWDADGGFADFATVSEAFAYRLPDDADPVEQAPLLCAGIIGYRALKRSSVAPGGRLGIWGFGASAHLTAQLAMAQGVEVHVFTRSATAQQLARRLGAASVQGVYGDSPVPLDAAIVFAPAGGLVPVALSALDRGGVLAIAGIHLSDIPPLNYERHLFYEREVRSVTSNTRADGAELLALAAAVKPELAITRYPFRSANRALADLAADQVTGVAVLEVS